MWGKGTCSVPANRDYFRQQCATSLMTCSRTGRSAGFTPIRHLWDELERPLGAGSHQPTSDLTVEARWSAGCQSITLLPVWHLHQSNVGVIIESTYFGPYGVYASFKPTKLFPPAIFESLFSYLFKFKGCARSPSFLLGARPRHAV